MDDPSVLVKRNLILALTLLCPIERGSCTKLCPDLIPGGNEPVTAYLRDSIIVVLPELINDNAIGLGRGVEYVMSEIIMNG